MKKTLLLIPIIAMLTACGTTDTMRDRASNIRDERAEVAEKILKAEPWWMTDTPSSESAIYAVGVGYADMPGNARTSAITKAQGEICMMANGTVNASVEQYNTTSMRSSSMRQAIQTQCKNVKIAGHEIASKGTANKRDVGPNPKIVFDKINNTYIAYVLIVLPTGDANPQRQYIDRQEREEREVAGRDKAFEDLKKSN